MKLVSLEEMGTGQVVRKEIQCAFNFVWKIMFSSMLLNIGLSLPHKSSTSNYCPNALLKLCFWPLFWNLLRLLPSPDLCSLKFEVKWSEVAQSCPTLCDPMDCSLPGFFCPWIFPGNSTGVGCHFLLQGILHCRQMLYPLSHQGSPLWSLLPPNHRTHIPWGCKVFFWSRVTQYLYWAPKTSWHGIKCLSSSAILPLHYVLIS